MLLSQFWCTLSVMIAHNLYFKQPLKRLKKPKFLLIEVQRNQAIESNCWSKFSDLNLHIWPPVCNGCKGHLVVPLPLPHCLGLPYGLISSSAIVRSKKVYKTCVLTDMWTHKSDPRNVYNLHSFANVRDKQWYKEFDFW